MESSTPDINEHNESFIKRLVKRLVNSSRKHPYIMGVITSLVASAIMSFFNSLSIIHSIPDRFLTMEENVTYLTTEFPTMSQDIANINTDLEEFKQNSSNSFSDFASFEENTSNSLIEINNSLSDLEKSTSEEIDKLNEKVNDLNDKLFTMALNVFPVDNTVNSINQTFQSIMTENVSTPILLNNVEPIAIDTITHVEYTASQLSNQKLLIPYTNEKGQEVFFYGQFNENNQWDGLCTTNIYENDNLIQITEGEYENGYLINYKQVFPFTTSSGNNVWSISERHIQSKNGNDSIDYSDKNTYYFSGESWTYFKNKDNSYVKHFNLDNVSYMNIITVQQFRSTISSPLEGYYSGNTSNGKYNDDTGTAYIIKYFENGTVRTLYSGNFQNGTFNDTSNNAWSITKNENTTYMYYKGKFKDEEPLHNKDSEFENYLTLTRINELLIENNFHLELNWAN